MTRFLPCLFVTLSVQVAYAQSDCRNLEYQQLLLSAHPGLAATYNNIERLTRAQGLVQGTLGADGGSPDTATNAIPAVITIPVVVHVLYNNSAQNITDAQVQSQINVLTTDYRGQNADRSRIPSWFAGLAADAGFRFALATTDPKGGSTTGIVRKWTSSLSFTYDDRAKSSALGGDDAWDADSYLNIWVCNTVSGLLGYSSLPGGPKDKDGVVISTSVFGTINIAAPFNKGRTTVHEIGHWLNLRHIWGDADCGDDWVDDTPQQQAASSGCPSGERFTCGNTAHGDMYMNYMDFTDDGCMFMFTAGQRQRMRALFATGGPRHALLSSAAMTNPPVSSAETTSFNMPAGFSVAIYPNPASSVVYIKTDESVNCAGKTVCVYNRIGQLLYSAVLSQDLHIDISRWESGIYFVQINGWKGKAMTKFIKQ